MKKIVFCLVLLTSFAAAYSQKVRLNAYGHYVFDDHVESFYSNTSFFDGTIKGGFLYGGGLEFRVHEYYGIELMYLRLDTEAPLHYYDYNSNRDKTNTFDLAINYIMVGGTRALRPGNGKAEPYGGFLLGMAILDVTNPENSNANSDTKFAWGLRLGTNVWASEKVGLKFQTMLLSIPQGAGGGLYFGTGGVGAGVSTYSTMLQFVLGGGLTFKLGNSETTTTHPQTGY